MAAWKKIKPFFTPVPFPFPGKGEGYRLLKNNVMEENSKEIIKEVPTKGEEKTEITPATQAAGASGAEPTGAPVAAGEKRATRRKKQAAPETKAAATDKNTLEKGAPGEKEKKVTAPQLKASLRQGFQLKGRYYSRAELGRKTVLEKLYKQYPGLFEK